MLKSRLYSEVIECLLNVFLVPPETGSNGNSPTQKNHVVRILFGQSARCRVPRNRDVCSRDRAVTW